MKKPILLTLFCLLTLTMAAGSAFATTELLQFSSVANSFITFNGNNPASGGIGTFSFATGAIPPPVTPGALPGNPEFNITFSSQGTSTNDQGIFIAPAGGWVINGPVDLTEGSGKSSVSGIGQIQIRDHLGVLFTANLTWLKIETNTAGNAGNLNDILVANLTNVTYTGTEADLITLRNQQPDTADLQFIFGTTGHTLTDLTTNGSTFFTSYSGNITSVPIPPSALLLGSGLLGLVGIRRFRKS